MSSLLPGLADHAGGYVYTIEFNSGTVKVGHSRNPRTRLKLVAGAARPHGISVSRWWVSQPHRGSKRNEDQMLAFCRQRGVLLNGGDYFSGVSVEEVVTFAETLNTSSQDAQTVVMTEFDRLAGRDAPWDSADPVIVMPTTEDVLARIDRVRGNRSRSTWLQEAALNYLGTDAEQTGARIGYVDIED